MSFNICNVLFIEWIRTNNNYLLPFFREVDRTILYKVDTFERSLKEMIKDKERELNIEKNGLDRIKDEKVFKVEEKEEVIKVIAEKENYVDKLMEVHRGNAYRYRNPFFQVYESLNPDLYTNLALMETKLVELKNGVKRLEDQIVYINSLKAITVDNISYREVSHSNISKSTYKFAGAISKKDVWVMFPEVLRFDTFEYFEAFKSKASNYIFFIDPEPFLHSYNASLNKVKVELENVEIEIVKEKNILQIEIEKQLNLILQKIETEDINLVKKLSSLNDKVSNLESALKRDKNNLNTEIEQYRNELENENKSEKFNIMRENKGKYTFYWKHERKTWQVAKTPLYFDVGKDYLFLKNGEHSFTKVNKIDFIQKFTAKAIG